MHRFSAENPESLREVARRAIEYCQKDGITRCELECEDIIVPVGFLDTPSQIVEKWRIDLNFLGLSMEDRWRIHELYVVQGIPATEVANKARLKSTPVAKYIRAKGWTRSHKELRENLSKSGDIRKRLDSWQARSNSSIACNAKGVVKPYECSNRS